MGMTYNFIFIAFTFLNVNVTFFIQDGERFVFKYEVHIKIICVFPN